jgi:thiol:disulfide interchange protein DsbC
MLPLLALSESEYKNLTDDLSPGEMIVYDSSSKTRHITVFTDIDCGYCRKLHAEVPALNASGVEVRLTLKRYD